MPEEPVTIFVNGERRELPAPLSVAGFLRQFDFPERGVAVELNLQIIPRARHADVVLTTGDHLEIVSLVGGG